MMAPIEVERLGTDCGLKYPDNGFEHNADMSLSYWENREMLKLDNVLDDVLGQENIRNEEFTNKMLEKNHHLSSTIERLKDEKNGLRAQIEQKKIMEITEKTIKEDTKELHTLTEEEELEKFSHERIPYFNPCKQLERMNDEITEKAYNKDVIVPIVRDGIINGNAKKSMVDTPNVSQVKRESLKGYLYRRVRRWLSR